MVRTRNTGSAVNKSKDHAAKGPGNTKNTNAAFVIGLVAVANDCQNSNVKKQKGGNEFGNDGPVE